MHDTDATMSVSRPREQRLRRRVAQALDLVVDRAVLFDVGVGGRDVRFGLVVVEVRDEILDGVVREELAKLGAQLRRQRFVVAEHERGLLDQLDDAGHRHRLAAPGHAEERLRPVAGRDARGKRLRSGGLVARQRERSDEFERTGHDRLFDNGGRNSVAPRRASQGVESKRIRPPQSGEATLEPESR